jgi:V/A-type H+-transporting ATPase subunit I
MLRPERMSRVSVTGAKPVLSDTIETIHDLNLVHVTDYDGQWEGFEPGDPIAGADEDAERLVTVRSLLSILDVDEDREGPTEINVEEEMDRLEEIRVEANRLDDRREELEDERTALDERADAMAPLETLGIDLDLLAGYDSLETRVGEADGSAVREALDGADGIESYETFAEDGVVAVFARPASDADTPLEDALVGVEFAAIDVPDAEGSPEEYRSALEDQRGDIEGEIEDVESDLADLREEHAEFLLAAEEHLAVAVQQREAPLSFATTKNAFVAEGWIPTAQYEDLTAAISDTVGEHVAVEELERASYDGEGRVTDRESTQAAEGSSGEPETAADGGTTAMNDDEPPVVQQNPEPVRPFEMLVQTVERPRYTEIDPSIILFLTLPLMYGFMIGDVGYGIIYTVGGYLIYRQFDSDAVRSLGVVGIWGGAFTIFFGFLYGEIFGYRIIAHAFWEGFVGLHGPPLEKGFMPTAVEYAEAWLVISVLFGLVHMAIGYIFDFRENLVDGVGTAILESGSWLVLMVGVWIWILSHALEGVKPDFLYTIFSGQPFALGFNGFSATVGWAAIVIALVFGLGLATYNEVRHFGAVGTIVGPLEGLRAGVVNPLSYTRLAAELLAEVGLAFAVNLLFFGAYQHEGEFHFLFNGTQHIPEGASVMFGGLIHAGILGVLFGIVVLVLGHLLVLGIGVMSAGLQAVRLEYVEFFNQFYEGGGEEYRPFGYERRHTVEE